MRRVLKSSTLRLLKDLLQNHPQRVDRYYIRAFYEGEFPEGAMKEYGKREDHIFLNEWDKPLLMFFVNRPDELQSLDDCKLAMEKLVVPFGIEVKETVEGYYTVHFIQKIFSYHVTQSFVVKKEEDIESVINYFNDFSEKMCAFEINSFINDEFLLSNNFVERVKSYMPLYQVQLDQLGENSESRDYLKGLLAIANKDFAKAFTLLNRAGHKKENMWSIDIYKAMVMQQLGDSQSAINLMKFLDKYVVKSPKVAILYAKILDRNGRTSEALETLFAIEHNEENFYKDMIGFELGKAYKELEDHPTALDFFQRTLKEMNNMKRGQVSTYLIEKDLYANIAEMNYKLRNNQKAFDMAQRSIDIAPNYLSYWVLAMTVDKLKISETEIRKVFQEIKDYIEASQSQEVMSETERITLERKVESVEHTLEGEESIDTLDQEILDNIYSGGERSSFDNMVDVFIERPSLKEKGISSNFFQILRHWSSTTPLFKRQNNDIYHHRGGGKFLYWNGYGLVIDPGFDFLTNFFEAGYSIGDINGIFVSHAHIDHCNDMEAILTLFFERQRNMKEGDDSNRYTVDLFINQGANTKFGSWITASGRARRFNILTYHNDPIKLSDAQMVIIPTRAEHYEVISNTSIGLKVQLLKEDEVYRTVGVTCDTTYYDGIIETYKECDLLIPHISSVSYNDFVEGRQHNQHLGYNGCKKLIEGVDTPWILLEEWWEGDGSARLLIAEKLSQVTGKKCIAGDLGCYVDLDKMRVRCSRCGGLEPPEVVTHVLSHPRGVIQYLGVSCARKIRLKDGSMILS